MILYGNPQELLGASSTELEVLYGAEDMGRSFFRRQASKAVKVVKKTPIAKVARVVKRNAPVAARVTTRVVKKAAPSLVPGGPQALSLYSRLTAAKKEIIPKFTTAPAQPKPQPGRPPRKPRQKTWKPGIPNARTQSPATTTAPGDETFFTKHKTPLLVGGVAGIGLLALLAMKKKQG